MYREFNLQAVGKNDGPLVFGWDDATGALTGTGAAEVQKLVDYAIHDGYVIGAPHPTTYSITDPLHRPAELAAVLSQFWCLDDYLGAAFQTVAEGSEVYEPGVRY